MNLFHIIQSMETLKKIEGGIFIEAGKEIQAFEELAKAVELLQQEIGYSNVEALGETLQNIVNDNTAQQVEGLPSNEVVQELNKAYKQLDLTSYSSEEIRRMIQFAFLKAAKEDGLQTNHQMTPDTIGLLVAYMIDQMTKKDETLQIADFAAGSGNLLSTILLFLQSAGKTAQGTAIDNDEVLVHLALQAFALEQLDVKTSLQDGLQDLLVDPQDFVVSDLPTKNEEGHSFAHHLLIEQHIRYLKEAGIGLFIVPTNLFETAEGETLLAYLQRETYVQAMLAFPRNLFKDVQFSKSLLIVQKRGKSAKQVSQVLLGDIPEFKNREKFRKFTLTFEKWAQEML